MVLFKQVNAKRIQMSEAEETETRDKWAANEAKQALRKQQKQEDLKIKQEKLNALKIRLGLTDDELDLIKNG